MTFDKTLSFVIYGLRTVESRMASVPQTAALMGPQVIASDPQVTASLKPLNVSSGSCLNFLTSNHPTFSG